MTTKILTSPISGFMELLPAEQIVFNKMLGIIKDTYEIYGFVPIDTPVLERADVLLAKAGGETEKQIYRFFKGDLEHAMRFDLTVPLARYVTEHYPDLVFPFKRYAIGKVYRGERPQAGRFREFYQCDIDVIGDETLDLRFDAELPSIIATIFQRFGFEKFRIRINNRKIFSGLFAGLCLADKSKEIMQAIDKIDKIGKEGVLSELLKLDLSPDSTERIMDFIAINGSSDEILKQLKNLGINNETFALGICELSEVVSLIRLFGVNDRNFKIDLSIARGLDYYTGTVYETILEDYPEIGSVCSGGRYEELASSYSNRKLPGVGVSIGLTRLFDQLLKKGIVLPGPSSVTKVMIVPLIDDLSNPLSLAQELRSSGIPTELSFVSGKLKKKMSYASKLGVPYVIFIGEEELKNNSCTIKDFSTGNQETVSRDDVLRLLKEHLFSGGTGNGIKLHN